jgi:CubicO group peptidase (beta-lactamase class C family)
MPELLCYPFAQMRIRKSLLLTLLLIVLNAATLRADDLDDFVRRTMQQRHIPAIAVAVVKDGVLVRSAGYGLADMENNIPAKTDTVFKVGSVSKQFFAAGIMLLVQDGKLSVDDKLSKHLPGVPASWQDITLRHLLTHTSGLVRESPGFDPYKIQPDIDVIKSAYSVPLQWKPGDQYSYSNVGYYTLAEVIHQVSGKPWHEFLNERVFVPLGMNSTRPTTLDLVTNRADGYIWEADKFTNTENWPAVRPSGAFLSTVLDMAKWEVALQTDRILTRASKEQMWKPLVLNNGQTYPYGFAWELDDFPPGGFKTDVPMIRHEGSIPGFRAAYGRFPKQNLGVIVLSNLQGAALDSVIAGIAIRFAPEVLPAALRRWEESSLR